jgi:GST-like protein
MMVQDPDKLQLFSAETPNGLKIAACLEEIKEIRKFKGDDFDYESHTVDIRHGESRSPSFKRINPNGKIPTIIDATAATERSGNEEVVLAESGAILIYLAEKFSELLPPSGASRYETIQWVMWSSAGLSVQVKSFGFYYKYCLHNLPYVLERNTKEVKRLLGALELQLVDKTWIIGDLFTIADVSIWPWIDALYDDYDDAISNVFDNLKAFPNVCLWYNRCKNRPASIKAKDVNKFLTT